MQLKNKRIVITGGTSGIGYELTKQLHNASSDNELIVISRSAKKLEKLQQKFSGIVTYQVNLSNLEEVDKVAETINTRLGYIDLLINNAAIQYTPSLIDDTFRVESISHEITLNFTSICQLTYRLLPSLLHDKETVILNINSGLSLAPKTSSAIYCATKGALNIFSQSLSYQLEKSNIKVQQAFLELVDTAMTEGRGSNKMTADLAAKKIIYGIEHDIINNDIGKVRSLRFLLRLAPSIAQRIMKKY